MIGPIRRGMVRRHANTDTRFSIDNQPLLPRAARHCHERGGISVRKEPMVAEADHREPTDLPQLSPMESDTTVSTAAMAVQ